MKTVKNIFICLVHENQDCIIDLVRNLKYSDPASKIILYNGGTDTELFSHFPFDRYEVAIHPSPKPLKWGWLHDFAIDCMEYALAHFEFDLITVVDSDQLACGKNYTDFVSKTFHQHPDLGMLGQMESRITPYTVIDPAVTAYLEKDLWQPFLETLPNGKSAFLHWTFWPSTAFTNKASAALVKLFRTNAMLREILEKTKIWASEEILLPTLTIALGYRIIENPCSYDYVKYRAQYSAEEIRQAVTQHDHFWIHPVERKIGDAHRIAIRTHFSNYTDQSVVHSVDSKVLIQEIFRKINPLEGWLERDEMESLVHICSQKITEKAQPVIVEIGSYCGKTTAVIALTAKVMNPKTKIIAIDDFSGRLGAVDTGVEHYPPSFLKFQKTLDDLSITGMVEIVKKTPQPLIPDRAIDVLLIDGLHDYANVARDFYACEKWVDPEGFILFHDYDSNFPGVTAFVNELLAGGLYEVIDLKSTLITLGKRIDSKEVTPVLSAVKSVDEVTRSGLPLVSCIMPTYNRAEFIEHAIAQFLKQDYPNKELIIIDDSEIPVQKLLPVMQSIRYSHYPVKLDIGTKRNIACKSARGGIIVHLDDDDFYAPDWLDKQVTFLLEEELEITGLSAPVFYDQKMTEVWQYVYPEQEKPWVYGATLCYTKKLWESNPFPVSNCGEDNLFVWSNQVKSIRPHGGISSYLGQIHSGNTSPKHTQSAHWYKLKGDLADQVLTRHAMQKEWKKK